MIAETKIEVDFSKIDRMGIAHNSVYPLWFEAGRRKLLKNLGVPESKANSVGLFLPVVELQCRYRSPAKLGDKLLVRTELTEISLVRVKFRYSILERKSGRVVATGTSVHVWTDRSLIPLNIEKTAPEIYRRLKKSSAGKLAADGS